MTAAVNPPLPAYVVGAGGLGLFLQSLLQGPAQSTLLARHGPLEKLRTTPLEVSGEFEGAMRLRIAPVEEDSQVPSEATVFITTRGRDAEAALAALRPRLGERSAVVLCSDGIGLYERARALVPGRPVLRLSFWGAVERAGAHKIRVLAAHHMDLAGAPEEEALLEFWHAVLQGAGVPASFGFDPSVTEWRKALFHVVVNGVCTLVGTQNGALLTSPDLKQVAGFLVDETVNAARVAGITLTAEDQELVLAAIERTRDDWNATLLDLRAGRESELPLFNGAVAAEAHRHQRRAPVNEAILLLVRHLEKAGALKA